MNRTQVRIRTYDKCELVDAIASYRVAGFTFLIHPQENGFTATYAPVGQGVGVYGTIQAVFAKLKREAGEMRRVIQHALDRMAEDHMPLLSGEEGIQTYDWQWREETRLKSGEYRAVPNIAGIEYPREHWVHMSTVKTETDWVSYTPSEAYGLADRQVRIKYGKYLRKTFENMTDAEVQAAVRNFRAKLALEDSPATLLFTTDRATINDIFETAMYPADSDSTSCMHGKFDGDGIRPYHVYADSPDVAVAYVMEAGKIISRSVVSTKNKRWVRCYSIEANESTQCEVLKDLLRAAGYTSGDLTGNRLTKLRTHRVMLPYIDHGGMDVDDDGNGFWRVVDSGQYTADQTDGTATENRPKCSRCHHDEDECVCVYCECCEESFYDGCDNCSMCPECDKRREHHACECDRRTDCGELVDPSSRYVTRCDCDRCGECGNLTDDCSCEPEETETEDTTEVTA
jgi:hypothetical protein